MARTFSLISALLLLGCSTDSLQEDVNILENFIVGREVVLDNVIACAALDEDDDTISVFFYPRSGATNVQYFETENVDVDKNDFENYVAVINPLEDVFNGFLQKFVITSSEEKWVIVAFDEDGKTHLSNPIRLKQLTKPTEYLPQNLSVVEPSSSPVFTWEDGQYDDTKIYFQVVSDAQNNFISGTYTFDRTFQFYNLNNVVLNITQGTPDPLQKDSSYGISLLAVSEDNWVNMFSEKQFIVN